MVLILFWAYTPLSARIGIFANSVDVGNPKVEGTSWYDGRTQSYALTGGGYNIWFERDEFQYLYNELEGDFILTANFEILGQAANPHCKTGWMVRASTDDNAAHFTATVHFDGLTSAQFRESAGDSMEHDDQLFTEESHYQILQIERSGKTYIFRAARKGELLQEVGSKTMTALSGKVLAGLFICSHDEKQQDSARIWNVRIDHPVADDYNAGKSGNLPCRLETMDVFTGERKVVWESDTKFEAPNWMPDGERLLFNMEGLLYTIPVDGGEPKELYSGSVNNVNNDHGISFDGKKIAISHRRTDHEKGSGSAIYVMPIEGGQPIMVTEHVPSYWHGWSPNNVDVVYVAKRDKTHPYNIFQADINTGRETQLTFFEGNHVDGPEYSPDGKWIYYNGSQTGTMQIWRMRPDGSVHEQLTFDDYNDWFPHVSPDGKWIAYLSYPSTVPADSHPSYKRVMLRLMSLESMDSRVIAYLYGGQGTINVPSWSPDSRRIAFVSNR